MIRINRYLYVVILLCFFLPFAEGCKWNLTSPEEKAELEKKRADSAALVASLPPDSLAYEAPVETVDEVNAQEPESSTFNKAASALLLPGGDYSGMLLVMTGWKTISGLTSIVPAFILLLALIAMTFRKAAPRPKRVFIMSALLSFFLAVMMAYSFTDLMYGYWLTLIITVTNTIIAYINYRNQQKISTGGTEQFSVPDVKG